MAGWLNKASNVFRRNTPEVEHPFAVPCECGLIHRGMRRNRFQKIVCRECGAARFILPKDVYPAPRDRPRDPPPVVESLPVLNPIKSAPSKGGKRQATAAAGSTKATVKAARDAAPEFFVVPARGRLVTPFRVVVVSITLIAAATGYFVVQKIRRDTAATALREASDHGWTAVSDQDWGLARTQLAKAVDAARILGRNDSAARKLQCGLQEVAAIEQLCPKSLVEILGEADAMAESPDKWKANFATHYDGRWLVFDGPLVSKPEGWRVPFPLQIGKKKRGVRIVIQSSRLDGVKEDEPGAIVAARLTGCSLSADKQVWQIEFEPETAFLWSLPETFPALGIDAGEFRTAEQTSELLARQAASNGVVLQEEKE